MVIILAKLQIHTHVYEKTQICPKKCLKYNLTHCVYCHLIISTSTTDKQGTTHASETVSPIGYRDKHCIEVK